MLLMCDSLAKEVRRKLAEPVRSFCPGAQIVLIANEHMEKPQFAGTFVYGVEGPEALIEAVRGSMSGEG